MPSTRRPGRAHRTWLVVVLAGVVAACSPAGDGDTAAPTAPRGTEMATGSPPGTSDVDWAPPPCDRPPTEPPEATAVPGSASDLDVTSFDGTPIRAHWFPQPDATAQDPAGTVLMGPGWSLPGDTDVDAVGLFGAIDIGTLRDAGFNVLTWDPRGFGESGGTAMIDSADVEGRDVQVLLDWVAAQPEVQLDDAGDPRLGMVGGSYGGGIQFVTAARDCRVDALVPVVAWHSLVTSLYKSEAPKTGWGTLLVEAGESGSVDPHARSAMEHATTQGTISDEDVAWLAERGPGELVDDVEVPTLIVQGTVDTLFTLDEGVDNYRILRDDGVPVSMLWYCGGHGTCLTDPGDEERVKDAAVAWLQHWVLDDATVELGPVVEVLDQHGATYAFDDYPVPTDAELSATGAGSLSLIADGGSGPAVPPPDSPDDALRGVVLPFTPGRAEHAVEVAVPTPADPVLVLGAPMLRLRYSGTSGSSHVYAQIVDETTGLVLGNQVTPIPVTLDGGVHTVEIPLELVAHTTDPGKHLILQIVSSTVAYAQVTTDGQIQFDEISITLPVASGVTPTGAP